MVAVLALLAGVPAGIVPTTRLYRILRRYRHHRRERASGQRCGRPVRRDREAAASGHSLICRSTPLQVFVMTAVVAGAFRLREEYRRTRDDDAGRLPARAKTGTPPSAMLMPMAFGSLLGGIVTLVGTSPNIIVSRVREEILGTPSNVRLHSGRRPARVGGVAFLAFGWRLLPERKGAASMDAAFNLEGYTTEVSVTEESSPARRCAN